VEPAECLVVDSDVRELLPSSCSITSDPSLFTDAIGTLCGHFGVGSLAALGLEGHPLAARAAAAVVRYTGRTNPQATALLSDLRVYDPSGQMVLDPTTRDHLELTRGPRGRHDGTLLQTLDRTRTAMGGRLLADWLGRPLLDAGAINARLDGVEEFVGQPRLRMSLQEGLRGIPDLERLAGRAAQRLLTPREALALANAAEGASSVQGTLAADPLSPFKTARLSWGANVPTNGGIPAVIGVATLLSNVVGTPAQLVAPEP